MDEQRNPEKIPMNPIHEVGTEKTLYENPRVEAVSDRDQVIRGMFKRPKQEPTISLKYQLFLAVIMILFVIAAVIVGKVLFKDGLI